MQDNESKITEDAEDQVNDGAASAGGQQLPESEETEVIETPEEAEDNGTMPKNKRALQDRLAELEAQSAELRDKNLRLFAEFENFRKRTARERVELVKTAGRDIITDLLPIIDDFVRAIEATHQDQSIEGAREGMTLLYQKLRSSLEQKGLKEMKVVGEPFDPEAHEAITELPVEDESKQGCVIEEVAKGYYLGETIIRFPKVVVGRKV